MISLVIWDFNGTIADDLDISIKAINTVLLRRKMKIIENSEEYRKIFCFPIETYYSKIGFDFEIEPYKIPADEWVSEYTSRLNSIGLSKGAKETIDKINSLGIPQIVLSTSEIKMLKQQLKLLGINDKFKEILGTGDVYGFGKVGIAKEWAESNNHYSLSDALLVGDTDHDFEVSLALGCKCVLYSGGHMSKANLKKCKAPVIDNIENLIDYIN